MASLLTVNALPTASVGIHNSGNVYHWYQTTDLVFPFDSITPIDHGYYMVPYAGFSDPEYPIVEGGWILYTTDPHDLPVEFLASFNQYGAVRSISSSIRKQYAHAGVKSVNLFSTKTKAFSASTKKVSFTKRTDTFGTTSLINFDKKTQVVKEFSNINKVSFTNKTSIFGEVKKINLLRRLATFSPISSIDLNHVGKIEEFAPKTTINFISFNPPQFTNTVEVNFAPKLVHKSTPIPINVSKVDKLNQYAQVSGFNIIKVGKLEEFTSTVKVSVSRRIIRQFTGPLLFNIPSSILEISYSNVESVNINRTKAKAFSPILDFPFHLAAKINRFSINRKVNILGNLNSKLEQYSPVNKILVQFVGLQLDSTECEWVVLKRIGMDGWRFFPFLEESSLTTPLIGATPDIRYHELVHAHQSIDLTYNINGNVERVLTYGNEDQNPYELISDRYIEYIGTFPCRATTKFYDPCGVFYKTVIEEFIQGPGGVIQADTINVIDAPNACASITGPADPLLSVGDCVYVDTFGVFQPVLATTSDTARAVGFVNNIIFAGQVVVRSYGAIEAFTGLTPGKKYFVSESLPGKIQLAPPTTSGYALKKVGIAQNTTTLLINIDETLALRS